MKNPFLPALALVGLLLALCSCQSTNPTAADMDKYYRESQLHAERQIAQYAELRDEGKLSQDEYEAKVREVNAGVGKHAMELAWTRHEMEEAKMRDLSIPTGGHPVYMSAPTVGNSDSFYRAAGSEGPGYQGMGSGMWHGYQPGTMADAFSGLSGR